MQDISFKLLSLKKAVNRHVSSSRSSGSRWPDSVKQEVMGLLQEGMSTAALAKSAGLPYHIVHYWSKRDVLGKTKPGGLKQTARIKPVAGKKPDNLFSSRSRKSLFKQVKIKEKGKRFLDDFHSQRI